jgi:hypothetical protein
MKADLRISIKDYHGKKWSGGVLGDVPAGGDLKFNISDLKGRRNPGFGPGGRLHPGLSHDAPPELGEWCLCGATIDMALLAELGRIILSVRTMDMTLLRSLGGDVCCVARTVDMALLRS